MRDGILKVLAVVLALVSPVSGLAQTGERPSSSIWTGPYFGLTLGQGGADLVGPGGDTGSQDGRETSIYTGFSWLWGQTFYGIEYDLTVNLGRDTVFGGRVPVGSRTAAVDWLTSLRGRFGVIAEETLIFATAGLSYADTVSTGRDYDTGFVYGGGIERRLGDRWSWRGEALFHRFSPDGAPDRVELDDAWVVRIGVARHF
jgi:hypothetical protein